MLINKITLYENLYKLLDFIDIYITKQIFNVSVITI